MIIDFLYSTQDFNFLLWRFLDFELLRFSLDLWELTQMVRKVIDPIALFNQDVLGSHGIDNFPLIDKLANVSNLWGGSWDTKSWEGPIVLVSSDCLSHGLLRISKLLTVWEWGLFLDLLENIHDSWWSLLDIVLFDSVVRPNKCISIWVHVQNKFHFILMLGQEVSVSLSFRLWERLRSLEVHWSRVSFWWSLSFRSQSIITGLLRNLDVWVISWFLLHPRVLVSFHVIWVSRRFSEIDWEISVQINALGLQWLILKLSQSLSIFLDSHISVLSDRCDNFVLLPIFFNQC